jgi:phage-related tail protein
MNNPNYNDQDNSGKGWALGFGLLAGVALGYYLNSNEGRAARRKAQVQFDEYGNQISEYGTQVQQQVSERASALSEEAKNKLEESKHWANAKAESLKTSVSETTASLKNTVNEKSAAFKSGTNETITNVEDSFKRGVDKAKAKVNATKA